MSAASRIALLLIICWEVPAASAVLQVVFMPTTLPENVFQLAPADISKILQLISASSIALIAL